MHTNTTHRWVMRSLAVTSIAALSACGGGGGGSSTGPVVVSTGTAPVLATGSDDFSASSETFPYYFADVDLDRDVVRGISSVRVLSSDTVELLDSESDRTFWLVLDSGTLDDGVFDFIVAGDDGILGTGDDVTTSSQFQVISRGSGYFSLYLLNDDVDSNGFPTRERVGGFGFETASADMPDMNVVDYDGGAFLYIVSDTAEADDENYVAIDGSFFMSVDFDDGSFDGTAFAGSELVNLDDVGDANDELSLTIGMSGSVSGNKLDGTVSGDDASVRLNGSITETPLTLTMSNSDVDGQFFGASAGVVAGTWGADFTLSDGVDSLTGEAVGFYEGEID